MEKINNPIQSLWIGRELSKIEFLCIESYLCQGHEFHLYVYDPISNAPKGTIFKDANKIISRNEIFIDNFGGFVTFSNKFRYTLLFKKGGWWVDMDTICLKPFDFEQDYVFSSESSDPNQRILINTNYIKSAPGSKFLQDCLDYLNQRGYSNVHLGELGANLLSRMIFLNNLVSYVIPPDFFCPISSYNLNLFIDDTQFSFPLEIYAIHLCNEVWRQNKLDKNQVYSPHSLYETLKNQYGITEKFSPETAEIPNRDKIKILMPDVTFLIPIRICSQEQLENFYSLLKFFDKDFGTNLIIVENDCSQKVNTSGYKNVKQYHFEYNKDNFYENQCIFQMIKMAETPIVGILDPDLIVPSLQILEAVDKIRRYNVQVCYPYDGRLFLVDDILSYAFKKTQEISFLKENISTMRLLAVNKEDVFIVNKEIVKNENMLIHNKLTQWIDSLALHAHYIDGPVFRMWNSIKNC